MADRRYTKNGEWVRFDGSSWKVGLAASAVEELGEINFVEAPSVGRAVAAGEAVCTVEAVKAAADFYSPVGGRISAVNALLAAQPQLLNTSPEDEGWLFALSDVSQEETDALLTPEAWKEWENGR